MADFFQPGPSKGSQTNTATPSPAQQAMMKFKAELLGRLLNAQAGNAPTFKSFVGGGPATRSMPANMGAGIAEVLQAMAQPGAFTSQQTQAGEFQGPTPSMLSDLTQLGVLGALLYNSGALGSVAGILGPLGGALGIGKDVGPGPMSSGDKGLDANVFGQYGANPEMIPGGDASLLPADYPGLQDDTSLLWSLLGY